MYHHETDFGFTNLGYGTHTFRVISFYFWQNGSWTPCIRCCRQNFANFASPKHNLQKSKKTMKSWKSFYPLFKKDWLILFFFFSSKKIRNYVKDRVSSRKPDKWQKLFLQLLVAILPRKMTFSKPITKKSLESRSFWRTTTVYEKPGQTQMSQVDPKDSKWSGVISRTIWYCN